MRILLIGYGKMGQAIERVAASSGHEVVGKINIDNTADLIHFNGSNTDVAIEFTQPESAYHNIVYCLQNNIAIVCGTTGWIHKIKEIESICREKGGAFFYASNYSIGVNLFFKLNEQLAKMMQKYPDYQVQMEEIHHTHKKDAPSGTAITLANGISENYPSKNNWTLQTTGFADNEIPIHVKREDEIPGTHTVQYVSDIDQITITHEAFNREGFASGAIHAATFLKGKKGIFGMDDLLK